MRLQVVQAEPGQQALLANLLELYAHDFSEFFELPLGEDGRFGYRHLPLYFSEPGRHPFLVRVDGRIAGLVLVKRGSEVNGDEQIWDMAEFFILRGYRKRGIGNRVAHEIWTRFRGRWEVRVMSANVPAQHFWARTIATFAGKPVEPTFVESRGWRVFAFTSGESGFVQGQ